MIAFLNFFKIGRRGWLFLIGGSDMEQTDWRDVIHDPDEIKVFGALADERWDWRTIPALCRESGLGEEKVRQILAAYPVLIRRSTVPSAQGEDLYTLQERYLERQGLVQKFWTFTSSSSASE